MYGASFKWNFAGVLFSVTCFTSQGGVELVGAIIDQTGNTSATIGVDMFGCLNSTVRNCTFISPGTAAGYIGIKIRNITPSDPATGSLWSSVIGCVFYGPANSFPVGVVLQGTANASTVDQNNFNGVLAPLILQNEAGQSTIPENVLVQRNFFEGYTTAILANNIGAVAATTLVGLVVFFNRFEAGTTVMSFTGMTAGTSAPPVVMGNYIVSNAGTYLNNPTNLEVTTLDSSITPALPQNVFTSMNGVKFKVAGGNGHPVTAQAYQDNKGFSLQRYDGTEIARLALKTGGTTPELISPTGQLSIAGTIGLSGTTTLSNNLRGSVTFAAATTATVTFGTAETNATYFIAISANANKTFWVTAKGTGGFTMNASAASSDTVDWVLIR